MLLSTAVKMTSERLQPAQFVLAVYSSVEESGSFFSVTGVVEDPLVCTTTGFSNRSVVQKGACIDWSQGH